MAKRTTNFETGEHRPVENDFPVYCTACSRRCLLYYVAFKEEKDHIIITDEIIEEMRIPLECPLPNI